MPAAVLDAQMDPLVRGLPLRARLTRLWRLANAVVDVRVAALLAFCGGWLVFTQIHCTVGSFERQIRPLLGGWSPYLRPMFGHLYWFWMGPIVLFLVPMGVGWLLLGMRPRELGLQVGNWRNGLKWVFGIYGLFLPVVVAVSFFGAFKNTYPLNHFVGDEAVRYFTGQGGSVWPLLLFEASYGLYFIGWEFFFRGFMGFALFRSLGYYGVFVATVPFAVMHVGKPEPEALGSVVAGIFLGFFALRERSFLYGALLHMLVAWSMDVLAVTHRVLEVNK
ncbi:MAG: CPBP family intramembrane metalloprotease [Deltaproteobacteria bacterium]|nr:CPBP family intramembrane metalloprotease [Deltaproteobacteria bacterium]